MNIQEKSFIVVAKEGYNVLLDINNQTLMIDCHNAINLSEMFSPDVLKQCSGLQAHLRDGNLVEYDGRELSKDPNDAQITKLNEIAEQQIKAQFSQHSGRDDAFNINIETSSDITDKVRKDIDERLEKNRDDIVKQDNKLLKHLVKDSDESESVSDPVFNDSHMTEKELHLNVTMDVDNNTFKAIQEQGQKDIIEKTEADEHAAKVEIQNLNKENN